MQPTNEAQDGGAIELHSRPETDDQNFGRTDPEQSANLDVRLAHLNALLHHYGLHASIGQYGEIDNGAMSGIWAEDLAEED